VKDHLTAPTMIAVRVLAFVTTAIAIGIFILDLLTAADISVAFLYVAIVLLSARFLEERGVVLVTMGCIALTALSYFLTKNEATPDATLANRLLCIAAIGVTAFLTLQNQWRETALRSQSGLLDLTHDTIFARDMGDVIFYWNRGAEEQYGWKREEAIGKVSHELMQTTFPIALGKIMSELLRTDRWEGELVHTRKDGTQAIVASRWSVQRDARGRPRGILETNNDITGRKQAEGALRRTSAYLAEAQRLSCTGSFGWKVSNGEHFWSEESFRILGYDPSTKPSLELFLQRTHPTDIARIRQLIDRAAHDGEDWETEYRLRMPNSTVKSVHVVARAMRDKSGVVEFVGAIMDISATKRAEEQLRHTQAKLAHISRVMTPGELTASIAHEVKQPIAGVVTSAQAALRWLAAKPPNLEEIRAALDWIVQDGRRADDVIGRIRALVNKTPSRQTCFGLNETILDVIALTRSEVVGHSVSLQTELAAGLPHVEADRVQLQQVILNLILNAVEAMSGVDESGRELLISTGQDTAGDLLVTVRDSGPGLDPQSIDRLFEAFYTTKPEGMGMRLAICLSIIEAHGGRLWASANEPRGASFQFTLPTEPDSPVPTQEPDRMTLA
jgi:PAS domain S-box-containing protein